MHKCVIKHDGEAFKDNINTSRNSIRCISFAELDRDFHNFLIHKAIHSRGS